MRVGILCTAHGFGHMARQLAVAEALLERGASVDLWTAAPAAVVHDYLPGLPVISEALDVGLVQSDSLTEDLDATRAVLARRGAESAIDALAERLRGYDVCVADVPPMGLEACGRAGVPVLATSNFDWAWIYGAFPTLKDWGQRFAAWQAPHRALQMRPGPDLSGFASVSEVGVVARWRPPARPPGVAEARKLVLVSFGGFGLHALDAALPRIPGVTWLLAEPMSPLDRPDCVFVEGVTYPALVGAADAVFTKPGYGIYAETERAGTKVAFVRRPGFPEAPFLEAAMEARGDVAMDAVSPVLLEQALEALWSGPPRAPAACPGAAQIAEAALGAT